MMCQCWVLNNCLLNDHPGHRGGHSKGNHPGRKEEAQVLGQLWLSKWTM